MNIRKFYYLTRNLTAGAVLLFGATASSPAATTLFSENFTGPTLNPLWVASLPTVTVAKGDYWPENYVGVPNYIFTTVSNTPVLRMNTVLAPLQRAGWMLHTNFSASSFRYEVRFNTLVQSPDTSIDAFIEIWVMDASDPTRYDIVSPFGSNSSTDLRFDAGSSITGFATDQSFQYQNNTWYRLVLHGATNENVRAAICDDNGNELIGCDLGHDTTAYPSGFTIALSQAINRPYNAEPTDVAVAWAKVTAGDTMVPARFGPAIQISWPTIAGRFYQLEWLRPGRNAKWANIGSPVAGTGSVVDFFEPQNRESILYRVELLP